MLHQINPSEKVAGKVYQLFKELNIYQLLRSVGIKKTRGINVQEIFTFIFTLALYGKNQYRFLNSKRGQQLPGKDAYYKFLNNPRYGWRRFLLMLALKVTDKFNHLTSDKRVRAFIVDDSPVARNRSKKMELLAKVFDHSQQRYIKGFNMLTLGWTDGYSFVPIDFAMLSSAQKSNRYNEVSDVIDQRTHGFKRRLEAVMSKPQVVHKLIENALNTSDLSLEEKEIIRIYGMRWNIEVFFKASKSLLKLGTEYQGRSYDMLIAHTTIVFSRYILLEWERRHNQDERSLSGLFFLLCDEIQDLDYETALRPLMYYFMILLDYVPKNFATAVSRQVIYWIASLPRFIQFLFDDFCYESRVSKLLLFNVGHITILTY